MRTLVLGGTEFVGRAVAEEALGRGWEVTVFNRGTRPAPAGAAGLRGDRSAPRGLAALGDGAWDLVVDTWTGAPSAVRDMARLLAGRVPQYTYISSRSVYRMPAPAGLTEEGPTVEASPDAGASDYAANKRGGELAAEREYGDRALFVRAGLIIGPHDNVGRLPWWLSRIARGGPVLAPGPRELPLQVIDARDLARWALDASARGLGGPYDMVSPSGFTTTGELLDTCAEVTGSQAALHWAPPEVVTGAGIEPWTEMPLWMPPGEMHDTIHRSDVSKVLAAGLRCRPVRDSVADTWTWMRTEGGMEPRVHDAMPGRPGVPPEKEAAALRALESRPGGQRNTAQGTGRVPGTARPDS
ncbi:NAD-dependent epimerase/dehydratase family protein [Streptomyces sp. YIM 98790]|uniref:NAD-dependent epimerase/dehydratase family protein n=1 Tax=Streptomyces sp. YIM 98790 TaxID=2689077 RepID=UPI00140B5D15|nr:NAD-dependent epimerase/dehydratase family protein [Streptomyces sp. YIM 98790]